MNWIAFSSLVSFKFLQQINEQMMKTKLCTFARKQILRQPIRNFWKIDWNVVFTWLKHKVRPVGHYQNIPCKVPSWNSMELPWGSMEKNIEFHGFCLEFHRINPFNNHFCLPLYQAHTSSCEFMKIPCDHFECGMVVKKADLSQHLETECKCRPETCGFCKKQIRLNKMKVFYNAVMLYLCYM